MAESLTVAVIVPSLSLETIKEMKRFSGRIKKSFYLGRVDK